MNNWDCRLLIRYKVVCEAFLIRDAFLLIKVNIWQADFQQGFKWHAANTSIMRKCGVICPEGLDL